MRTYLLTIEDDAVLVEIKQYDANGEETAISVLIPPEITRLDALTEEAEAKECIKC